MMHIAANDSEGRTLQNYIREYLNNQNSLPINFRENYNRRLAGTDIQ